MTGTDWREQAERGDWQKIDWVPLSKVEQSELTEMLMRIVPGRERGHGVETYEGFIRPSEARTSVEHDAAYLLEVLLHHLAPRISDQALDEPVKFAINTLAKHEIYYEGWHSTYLYWHPRREVWVQVSKGVGEAILNKRRQLFEDTDGLSDEQFREKSYRYILWENHYPWRRCQNLQFLFRVDQFEPYTPLWYALNILNWNDLFDQSYSDEYKSVSEDPYSLISGDQELIGLGIEVGRSFEALLKKPYEPHALRGIKSVDSATEGAKATAAITSERTQPRLKEMKRLVPKLGVAGAANHLEAKGMGTFAANRGLWYRQPKK